jgi:hypothetical protein
MEQNVSSPRQSARWQYLVLLLAGGLALVGGLVLRDSAAPLAWALRGALAALPAALLLAALYVAPGAALLRLLWPQQGALLRLPLAAWLALALALSAALPPLLLLLCSLLGLPWGGAATGGYVLLALLLAVWPTRPDGTGYALHPRAGRWPWQSTRLDAPSGVLLVLALLVLLFNLYAVRDLPTGLLGDSYQHTMIARLLVENGGLFESWQPYAPLTTLTYHFGFHSNAAFVHWITGIEVTQSVLLTGQVLMSCSVLSVAVLLAVLGAPAWAGVWAVLLVGFALMLPSYFVNWGRYTQLTGQVVLVATLAGWVALAEHVAHAAPGRRWPELWRAVAHHWCLLLLAALATAALLLTHYRVVLFGALFVGSYLLALLLAARSARVVAALTGAALLSVALALALVAPWLLNVLEGYLLRNATSMVSGGPGSAQLAVTARLSAVHPFYMPRLVVGAAFVGLLVAGWRRQWRIALPAGWAVLLVLTVVPQAAGLPGRGLIDYLTAYSALYLTLPLLVGYLVALVQAGLGRLGARWRVPPLAGMALLVLLLAGGVAWGAPTRLTMIDGSTQLVSQADMAAMRWIREHTSPDARFLVNSFPSYGGTLIVGSDAGWWLPLLTGRASTLPPLTYGLEVAEEPDYAQRINALAADLRGLPLTDRTPVVLDLTTPAALQRLREAGVDYVYSGATAPAGDARVDYIDTERLAASAAYERVYQQDGVEIFRLRGAAAPAEQTD